MPSTIAIDQTAAEAATLREEILEHVSRYRLTILAALARQLRMRSRKVLQQALRSLCREGQLGEAPLYHQRPYYFLAGSRRGSQSSVHESTQRGPLSEQAKLRAYALLSFCCLSRVRRKRLTPEEIAAHLPDLYRPGLPGSYYVASGEPPRFGLAVIDAGGRGRWDRVLQRIRSHLEEHCRHPALRPFIEQGSFEITVLTMLPQKAQRLALALAQWRDPRTQLVRIAVLPELIHLIAPHPSGTH